MVQREQMIVSRSPSISVDNNEQNEQKEPIFDTAINPCNESQYCSFTFLWWNDDETCKSKRSFSVKNTYLKGLTKIWNEVF